ncbi:type II secretion system F family protein [Bariatricus massiliensis]|uniref:Type II secretion system F family protein n=1 Tax=Bariatricus massiliensis TaxID=1745713 RepID=A0ABS8DID5_9FIRM|nr:type II secretion system F family protein [Bariatricus massiliensis]MCB7305040.1 type II secretion system F family protein [Bariatricus massiliensis]MCB7375619.1 type II secretion system F family protein [Bariatricus massiliensis]MCB7388208.1 type II secretion system F family protein [Bariatricus massiliensis]MCB7412356.1 type II secretion system F family protein [Bariatricus massiliensis]MCQ5254662.1 type II secretion system F family protein [Bariatricus massiliensis]
MAAQVQQKSLSNMEIAAFSEQMAMILKSGISSMEGLSIMLEDAQSEAEKVLLGTMNEEMLESGKLYDSLKKTAVFPSYMLQMVQIGEETGTLDEVMESLSSHYKREEAIAKSIRSALTYPLIMIGMMLLVVIVLITKVMPIFNQVFIQLGREMTGFSGGILALGGVLSRYASVFIALLIALILLFIYFTKTASGRSRLLKLGYHFRFSRELYEKMAACRFADGMSLTLKSGATPEHALEFSKNLIDNPYFLNKIVSCQELLSEGKDLPEALHETKIFTGIYSRMTSLAGKAGIMDEIMETIAAQYEEEVDEKINSFISVLEPTLVIILSIIVGIILFSVMLPLMGIMAGL